MLKIYNLIVGASIARPLKFDEIMTDNQWLPLRANLDISTKIEINLVGGDVLDAPFDFDKIPMGG